MRLAKFSCLLALALLLVPAAYAQPMHVYLTYSDDPATSMDINFFVEREVPEVTVYLDTESRGGDITKYKHFRDATYTKSMIELVDRRALYVVALKDLKPNTDYYFVAGDPKYGYGKERKFRTLAGGDAPVRFVNGGDMGASDRARALLEYAGKENPDFAVIGGDIAYVNGLLGGYVTWDAWLKNWDELMVTTDGRMIPIVTAIGNHEVNRYESDDPEVKSPWYIGLFGRQGEEVYYSRKFGDNIAFILLDSGHHNEHAGEQAAWLERELAAHADVKYTFAAYHVPLYPAHRPYEGEYSKRGRTHWAPLFDRYGLTIGFEHHDHVLKRSKPLKGNQVDPSGTVYIGDGTWGTNPRTIDPEPRWYNEVEGSIAHFWVIDATNEGLAFKAIDENGDVVDTYAMK
jgi:hypothetical protein